MEFFGLSHLHSCSSEFYFRGHGTFENDGSLYASLCGVVEVVNKLVFVRPVGNSKCVRREIDVVNIDLHYRYEPEVGDVVVGRVSEVSETAVLFLLYVFFVGRE